MNKKEFLRGLEEALLEQMDISEAAPHIRYYQDYIESEITNGKDEYEVIKSLQNPRLIAKNIVNNSKSANKYKSDIFDSENNGRMYNQQRTSETYNTTGNSSNGSKISFSVNGRPVNSLLVKIALIAIAIVLVVLVFVVVGGILWILTKFVLPVLIIGAIIYMVAKLIKNNL